MSNTALRKAMDNAEASINMEGLHVPELCKELCEKLLKKSPLRNIWSVLPKER